MADVLRLATESQGTTVDFLSGTFKLEPGSWRTRTASNMNEYSYKDPFNPKQNWQHYEVAVETMTLVAVDTATNIRSGLDAITDALEGIRKYHDERWEESWWLEWNIDGESAKRALLYEGSFYMPTTPGVDSMLSGSSGGNKVAKIVLSLSRHPLWENTTVTQIVTGAGISTEGGQSAFTSITGNAPSRISSVVMLSASHTNPLTEIWMGFRPTHKGDSNYESVWQAGDGTVDTDCTDGGDYMYTDFSDTSLVRRFGITVDQACSHSDYDHQVGRYLVLARCYVSSSGTAGIKMYSGYDDELSHTEVFIDNGSYKYVPLGEIQIPPWTQYDLATDQATRNFKLSFYAERLSAAGSLYIDNLVLMPSEHMLYLNGFSLNVATDTLVARVLHDGTFVSYGYDISSQATEMGSNAALTKFHVPVSGGMVVLVAQGDSSHETGATITTSIYTYPRWLAYR